MGRFFLDIKYVEGLKVCLVVIDDGKRFGKEGKRVLRNIENWWGKCLSFIWLGWVLEWGLRGLGGGVWIRDWVFDKSVVNRIILGWFIIS